MTKLIGDWLKVDHITKRIEQLGKETMIEGLVKTGLFAEGTAKKHMSRQDLGWKALNKDYKDYKKSKGLSTNTLVATSAYFQAITSFSKGKQVNVGVKKVARDKEGNEIANIAAIHEFGSTKRGIPARPLWKPTLDETNVWLKKNGFDKIIIKKLNRLK
tara:strand:- start:888 stop:1364 length:477 start_codon:yes stop_codon:yes gene_type:complete